MAVRIRGLKKIDKNFMKLARVVDDERILYALVEDAERLRDGMKMRVPVKTGRLKRSIVAKRFKYQQVGNPSAFVAIDRNPETGAPHAHLVEYGTSGQKGMGADIFSKSLLGQRYHKSGKWVGGMPPQPFFRKSVRAYRKHVKTESALKKLLDEIRI